MTTKNLLFLFVFSLLVSCAAKNKKSDDDILEGEVAEVSDELLLDDTSDEVVIDDTKEDLVLDDSTLDTPQDTMEVDTSYDSSGSETASAPSDVAINTSATSSYTAQSGDTLMLIAWKIYGDYSKWRDLARLNQGSLASNYSLSAGQVVNYNPPAEEFNWSPQGSPYLILRGDTLGLISNKVYGTNTKWRKIYDNNRPLIKDPNLIFAGFTIYYTVDEVASL